MTMKKVFLSHRFSVATLCFTLLVVCVVVFLFRARQENYTVTGVFSDCGKSTVVHKIVEVKVDGKSFRVQADVNDRGVSTDEYVRNMMSLVSNFFSELEWSESRMVEFSETESEVVITWPVPDEMSNVWYRSDYDLRIEIDKETKQILRVSGG